MELLVYRIANLIVVTPFHAFAFAFLCPLLHFLSSFRGEFLFDLILFLVLFDYIKYYTEHTIFCYWNNNFSAYIILKSNISYERKAEMR